MRPRATAPELSVVADLMTRRPIVVGPSETVAAAAARMRACRIRHLPVTNGGALVGVLSLRDVLVAAPEARVDTVMHAPVTAFVDAAIDQAAERMLRHNISCLPVVDGEGAPIGIFTATDALRHAAAALDEEGRQLGRMPGVEQVMTSRPLVTVAPEVLLADAWRTMQSGQPSPIRHLPVVVGDVVVGILSDRDVLSAGRSDDRLRVTDAMSRRVRSIAAAQPAADAAKILHRSRVGALPVLRGRSLVGMVSVSDFLYWIVGGG